MCCLGRCHENGAFHFAGKNYSARSAEQIEQIVKGESADAVGKDRYHVSSNLPTPILVAEYPGTERYFAALLQALASPPEALLEELKLSGLRGRGGAGFPMALKWEGCKNSPGAQKYIVCNADEGDPGAYSDRYLLEERPHSVLFGMMIAGYITGANAGVLYIRAEYPEAVEKTADAVRELEKAGYLGKNIKGSGFDFEFKVIKGAGAYICGEETALLSSLEGQRPEVRVRPPYPTVEGLFNKPTVVNNVETFASVHYILGNGGQAYANLGKGRSTGSKLVCLDGFFNRPGVYEVEMGTPLRTVVDEMGQGFREPIKALHIGGPLGRVGADQQDRRSRYQLRVIFGAGLPVGTRQYRLRAGNLSDDQVSGAPVRIHRRRILWQVLSLSPGFHEGAGAAAEGAARELQDRSPTVRRSARDDGSRFPVRARWRLAAVDQERIAVLPG